MALQTSLRRGLSALRTSHGGVLGTNASVFGKRMKSSDAGDVIGIDLGTTNSCVAIMVSFFDSLLRTFST
jgi:molecular chaperone DnaK